MTSKYPVVIGCHKAISLIDDYLRNDFRFKKQVKTSLQV